MNLNRYGGACRCLLRLRENEGRPRLSDTAFLERYGSRHPEWRLHPGLTDDLGVFELARDLELATGIEISRDYDRVLPAFRAGHGILVRTGCTPVQREVSGDARSHVLVLTEMASDGFVAWCPFESGSSDLLPWAARIWWDRWQAVGLILSKDAPAGTG